jgi:hypothetical protein
LFFQALILSFLIALGNELIDGTKEAIIEVLSESDE